jgi:hypothetical protein
MWKTIFTTAVSAIQFSISRATTGLGGGFLVTLILGRPLGELAVGDLLATASFVTWTLFRPPGAGVGFVGDFFV